MAGAGSGAGALITTKGECSQAFICAILDHFSNNGKVIANGQFTKGKNGVLGEGKNISYKIFIENIEKVVGKNGWKQSKNTIASQMLKVTKISLPQIEKFLETNHDWFASSVNIANGLSIKLKAKLPKWNFSTSDFIYYRQEGSTNALMDNIQSIFTIVNKANDRYFGTNINRWCPADIYIGTESGEREVKKLLEHLKEIDKNTKTNTSYNKVVVMKREVDLTFDSLNYIFRAFVNEGLILPVSLKKYSSTNFDIAPVKLFNSGPPITGTDKKQLSGDVVKITFDDKYLSFGLENSNFYSSMDVYIIASKGSAESVGFKSLKIQIRDKGSSSSNTINPKSPNISWKFGIQAITKFEPSEAQAGGIGGGNLAKISDVALPTQDDKIIVTNIASKFEWNEDKNNFIVKDITNKESKFINEFRDLQSLVQRKSSVSFRGAVPPTTKNASDKLIFYLKQLSSENGGLSSKLEKKKIDHRDRYKVAQWFLTKYYCLKFAEKMSVKNNKNIESLQQIFLVSLSMDPKGPIGKKGGGSTFYAKAGQ
jgi:hypothetical protein